MVKLQKREANALFFLLLIIILINTYKTMNLKETQDYMLWLREMQEEIFFYQLDEHFKAVEKHAELYGIKKQ